MARRCEHSKDRFVSHNKAYMKVSLTLFGSHSILCSIVGGVCVYLDNSFGIVYSICLWGGILVLALGALQIYKIIRCTEQIEATCSAYQSMSGAKGGTVHFPQLSYTVKRVHYISITDESYLTLKRLQKHYKVGKSYTIWIDPTYPNWFVTDKKLHLRSVVCIAIGLLVICAPIYHVIYG